MTFWCGRRSSRSRRSSCASRLHAQVTPASPHIVVAIDGAGIVESQGMEPISFATGDAVVIPAAVREYTVRPQWELEIMRMSLPTGEVAEPETVLGQPISAPYAT